MDRIYVASDLPSTPAPQSRPVAAISDDLWNALKRGRRTACAQHSAWADHCAHLHQRAGAAAA